MLFTCEACQRPLKAENIDFSSRIASCAHCGAVMRLEGGSTSTPALTPKLPQPERFTVEEGVDLVVSWKWNRIIGIFLIFFSVIWDGAVGTFLLITLSQDGAGFMLPFLTLHLLAGLFLPYFAVANLLNSTELRLGGGQLAVRYKPLWWKGQQTLEVQDLEQFYVLRRESTSKNGVTIRYDLMVVRRDGIAVPVVDGLNTVEEARFLEQLLEEKLGIRNRVVAGEA